MKKYARPVIKSLKIKKNYTLLTEYKNFYYKENDVEDDCIDTLVTLFNDHGSSVKWLLGELLDPQSRGITASLTDVSIDKNRVILEPTRTVCDNPEDYAIELGRDELFRLAQKWQTLVDKKTSEIFIYSNNDQYFVADTLPKEIER